MALPVIDFFKSKTVKLTDSYVVRYYTLDNSESVLPGCISVTLPKLEFEEDTYYFGNTSKKFLIPKYDSVKELTIELLETSSNAIQNMFNLNKNNVGVSYAADITKGIYNIQTNELKILRVDVYDNNFNKIKLSYIFENLKLVKYDMYTLSYTDETPCKISMTFAFKGFAIDTDPAQQ